MGCGKSAVGRELAKKTDKTFLDTDEWIEEKEGITISEIFASKGETYFRDLETECLSELLQKVKYIQEIKHLEERCQETSEYEEGMEAKGYVISVGGGLPLREENQRLLKELGQVVYLKAEPETVYERIKGDTTRPLLQTENPKQRIKDMMAVREEKYQTAAHKVLVVDGKGVSEVVDEISDTLLFMF